MKYKNTIRIGSTRSGKSMSECRRLVEAAEAGAAIVVIDPHPHSLASTTFEHLVARGLAKRVLFDRTTDLRRVLGYDFFAKPTAATPLEYASELFDRIRAFGDLLLRRREMASLATSPQLEEWVIAALTFYIEQDDHPPLPILNHAFSPGHPDFHRLLRRCRNFEVVAKFRAIESGAVRRSQYLPAERIITGICRTPAFGARSASTFDLPAFLDRRGILLVEGNGSGSDAERTIMGAIILQTIHYIRARSRRSPQVILALDEANNAGLIGASGYETRAAAETQKMGLAIDVLVQSLDFPTPEITTALMTNCLTHHWYYAGSADVLRKATADLGGKQYEEWIRALKPGQSVVKDRDRGVFREYLPLLEDPWGLPGLSKKKAQRALQEILQRPEYHTPRFVDGRFVDDAEIDVTPPPNFPLPADDSHNPNLGI